MFDRTRCGCNYSCFLRISLLKPFVSIPKFQFSCRRNRILGLSCICLHPSCPQPWPVFDFLADEEHPHSMVLPSPCFAVLWGWCYQGDEHCWVLTKVTSLCHVKNVHFCFFRPEHHACWDYKMLIRIYKIAFLQMVFDFFKNWISCHQASIKASWVVSLQLLQRSWLLFFWLMPSLRSHWLLMHSPPLDRVVVVQYSCHL